MASERAVRTVPRRRLHSRRLRATLLAAVLGASGFARPAAADADANAVPAARSPLAQLVAPASFRPNILPRSPYEPRPQEGSLFDSRFIDMSYAQAIGCISTATLATGATLLSGPGNVMSLLTGGKLLVPDGTTFSVGLLGIVFVSFCSIGQALTPLYIEVLYSGAPPEPAPPREPLPGPRARTIPVGVATEIAADDFSVPASWRKRR